MKNTRNQRLNLLGKLKNLFPQLIWLSFLSGFRGEFDFLSFLISIDIVLIVSMTACSLIKQVSFAFV